MFLGRALVPEQSLDLQATEGFSIFLCYVGRYVVDRDKGAVINVQLRLRLHFCQPITSILLQSTNR